MTAFPRSLSSCGSHKMEAGFQSATRDQQVIWGNHQILGDLEESEAFQRLK